MRKESLEYLSNAIDSVVKAELYYKDRPYGSRVKPDNMVLDLLVKAKGMMKDAKEFIESAE